MSDPLRIAAESHPDRMAVIDVQRDTTISYADLDSRVDHTVRQLQRDGVRPGERIGLLSHRTVETVVQIHAIARYGATVVPVDPELQEERIHSRLNRCHVSRIIDEASPRGNRIVPVDAPGTRQTRSSRVEQETNRPLCMLFTSGTTGQAAPIPVLPSNFDASAAASAERLGTTGDDRWISPMSLAQMGGIAPIYRAVRYGTGVMLSPFDSTTITKAIRQYTATGMSLVPTMLRKLLQHDVPLDALRVVLVGGDTTDPELVRDAIDANIPLYVTYGMTEATSQIATATPAEIAEFPETVGKPLHGTLIQIDSPDQQGAGEILVSGDTVVPNTYQEITVDRVSEHGVLQTGDLGYLDEQGRLYVTGRLDERIVTGGATVDPQQVEQQLRQIEGIDDAVVVGVADDIWGEKIAAILQVKKGETVDEQRLREAIDERFASSEKPRQYLLTATLPRTPAGTVDRKESRTMFEDAQQTEIREV